MELSTETLTEEGGTDGAVCVRESQDRIRLCELHSLVAIVLAVIVSSSLPPPVRVAVTVMEYSVPSSRPGSVYAVSLPAMVFKPVSVKQSVSVAE